MVRIDDAYGNNIGNGNTVSNHAVILNNNNNDTLTNGIKRDNSNGSQSTCRSNGRIIHQKRNIFWSQTNQYLLNLDQNIQVLMAMVQEQ